MALRSWAAAFKECDIRGPYPEQVDEELAYRLGIAVATETAEAAGGCGQPVVVAGDVRLSTPALQARVLEGLRHAGAMAFDCGILPTPGYYFARRYLGVEAGVMVTASHSPPGHNGFKPILGRLPITPEELGHLRRRAENPPPPRPGGAIHQRSVQGAYRDWLVAQGRQMLLDKARRLAVVVDCGNGCFSGLACEVLAELGLHVIPLFCEPDGRFPNRSPDVSRPEALEALGCAVRQAGADLGVAFDGDGDRVAFADETGAVVGPDVFVPLLAADALRRFGPGPVVLDIKLSRAADEVVRHAGGTPLRERSGHTFMKTRVICEGAVLGGEGSGHVFFRELEGGDDGLYAAMVMMRLMADTGRPLSALAASVPKYVLTRDIRVPFEGDARAFLERLANTVAGQARVERVDGVKAHYPDGWALARASVTEPAITMRFEAETVEALRSVIQRFLAAAPELLPPALAAAEEAAERAN